MQTHPPTRRRLNSTVRHVLVPVVLFTTALSAYAKTLTVTNGQDQGPGSLRRLLSNGEDGDIIEFADGLKTISLTSAGLKVERALTISGPGANRLTIRRSARFATPNFGIFYVAGGQVTISGVRIANGRVALPGAGIYVENRTVLTLTACTISGNQGHSGAGVFNGGGVVHIKACTISDNAAVEGTNGGGLFNAENSTMTIARSTIAHNFALHAGAVMNFGILSITNSTIADNSASGTTGGIFTHESFDPVIAVRARNTIIAANTDQNGMPDYNGPFNSQGFNLFGSDTGITAVHGDKTGNQRNVDPMLGPLQDNGGTTFTKALLAGSPAIDRGDSGQATIDQRGLPRPVDNPDLPNAARGNGADIGAVEMQSQAAQPEADTDVSD